MILVIDANILVAESLRKRGRELLGKSSLEIHAAAKVLNETEYELRRRIRTLAERNQFSLEQSDALLRDSLETLASSVTPHPESSFSHLEEIAKERIPRDPNDWKTVALALVLGSPIWTQDTDFLGCGIPTWTTDTLIPHLMRLESEN